MKLEIGGGFLGTLTLIFVIAKLWGYIDWSWWIVFSPIIIPVALTVVILLIIFIIIMILTI